MTPLILLSSLLSTNVQTTPLQVHGQNPVGAYLTQTVVTRESHVGAKQHGKLVPLFSVSDVVTQYVTTNFMRLQFVAPPVITNAPVVHHPPPVPKTNAPAIKRETPRERALKNRKNP